MSRKIEDSFGRDGKIHGVGHDFFRQVAINFIDFNALTNIYGFDIGEALIFGDGLIYFFVQFNSISEVIFGFFMIFLLIIQSSYLNFLDIFRYYLFLIAYRFDPDEFILTVNFLSALLSDMLSSGFSCVCAIKNGHFVLLTIDESYHIFQT